MLRLAASLPAVGTAGFEPTTTWPPGNNHGALTCCSTDSGLREQSVLVRARPLVSDPIVTLLVIHVPQHGFRL
jgi:hypothetical protein